jgi:hypothetical protein
MTRPASSRAWVLLETDDEDGPLSFHPVPFEICGAFFRLDGTIPRLGSIVRHLVA